MIPGITAGGAFAAGGGGGTVAFTPALIATQLWFDAADASTVTIATGVSEWRDKSGNARHVVQATAANQPAYNAVQLNSLPTLSFDGTNDRLRKAGGLTGLLQNIGTASLFIVRRHTTTPVTTSDVVVSVSDGTTNTARITLYGAQDANVRAGGKRTDAEALNQIEVGGSGLYPVNVNTWEMLGIACNYNASDGFVYLNGALLASNTSFASAGVTSNTESTSVGVGCWINDTLFHTGGIAEIVVTHGIDTAQRQLIEGYLAWKWGLQGNLPAAHPYKSAAPTVPVGDPYYDDVVSLLHLDGANGSTTFTDEKGIVWTASGDAQLSTAVKKFGSASATFDGTDDLIDAAANAGFTFGVGDYTIELFGRFGSLVGNRFLAAFGSNRGIYSFNVGTPTLAYFDGAANQTLLAGGHVVDTFYHIALCRAAGITRLFRDGQVSADFADSSDINTTNFRLGSQTTGAGDLQGFIDEVRITRRARYTAAFTPPISAFENFRAALSDPHYASVVSLLNFEGANAQTWFLDERGKLWTRAGAAALSNAQMPFGFSSLAVTSANDNIGTASSADFAYGTGDFTIEMFIRTSASITGGDQVLFDHRSSSLEAHITIVLGATNKIWYAYNGVTIVAVSANGAIPPTTWQHVALCRSGGTGRLYVNGAQVASGADTNNYAASSAAISRVRSGGFDTFTFLGHVKGLRITKGVARYTGNFTPPSALFPDH